MLRAHSILLLSLSTVLVVEHVLELVLIVSHTVHVQYGHVLVATSNSVGSTSTTT